MTSPTENPIAAIQALLEERERYEGWMATLETRRDITPAAVYERVRTDYERRLREVLDRLGGRSGDLKDMASTLAERVTSLEGNEMAKRDARAEAELRALVGEYPPERWEEIRRDHDGEIERLAGERDEIAAELTRVQGLLAAASAEPRLATPAPGVAAAPEQPSPPAAAAPAEPVAAREPTPHEPSPAVAPEVPLPPMPVASPASAGTPGSTPAVPAGGAGGFDELAFLQSVIDTRPGAAATAGAGTPSAGSLAQPPREGGVGDVARTLAADLASDLSTGAPAPRATSPAMHRMANPVAEPRPTGSMGATGSTPSSSFPAQGGAAEARPRTSDNVPAFLRDVPSEQVKTLKCQECGTMNYPTEWYCERCGGELAAM